MRIEFGFQDGEKRDLTNRKEPPLFWGWGRDLLNASDWEAALTLEILPRGEPAHSPLFSGGSHV